MCAPLLLQKLKLVEFTAGDVITKAGETGTSAYWLLSGGSDLEGKGPEMRLHEE